MIWSLFLVLSLANASLLRTQDSIYNGLDDNLENDLSNFVLLNLIENLENNNQLERESTKSKRAKIFLPTLF